MKWNNHYKKQLSLISPIKKRLACSVQSSSYGARGRLLSTKRNSVKSHEHSGQTLRIHEFENNKRDWRKVRKCVRQMKERFLRKIKFWLYFVVSYPNCGRLVSVIKENDRTFILPLLQSLLSAVNIDPL